MGSGSIYIYIQGFHKVSHAYIHVITEKQYNNGDLVE